MTCFIINRASAYDVFAPSVLNSAAGISANPSSRRSSFRTAPEPNTYKETSPSPEKNDASLFVEEDRRMRRRGSQLYVNIRNELIFLVLFLVLFLSSLLFNSFFFTRFFVLISCYCFFFISDFFLFYFILAFLADLILVRFVIELHYLLPIQIN